MIERKASKLTHSEKKRAAIVAAAKDLFLAKGYSDTSMDEITHRADVSKKTVYNHFPGKAELFQSVILDHWNDALSATTTIFSNEKSVEENLRHFAKKFLDFVYQEETISLFRLLISEAKRFPDLCQQLTVSGKAPFTRELMTYLRVQVANKKLKIKDYDLAASQFIGLLKEYHYWPMMMGFVPASQNKSLRKVINASVEMFLSHYFCSHTPKH